MKRIFIINPVSGNGKALKVIPYLEYQCIEKNFDYEIIISNEKNTITKIVENIKNPNTIVYSVGGDGTLSEVINGLNKNVMFSLIPAGTGNDFYKSIKELDDDIVNIDLGTVNNHKFINSASIGIDANIANIANNIKEISKLPSSMVYNLGIVKGLIEYKANEIIKDNERKNITLMAICNGSYYGGGIKIAPDAKLNDGYFDVISVDHLKIYKIIPLLIKLLQAEHINSEYVNVKRIKEIKLESTSIINCNIDGEIIKDNHFEFKLLENEITLYNKDDLNINKILKLTK